MKILLTLMITLPATLFGQVINPQSDTIRWEYNGMTNLRNQELISLDGYFISTSGTLQWIQHGVDSEYTLTVISSEGSWTDTSTEGTITHTVTCQDVTGTVTISGSAEGLKIRMDFRNGDALTPYLEIPVTSHSKLQNP